MLKNFYNSFKYKPNNKFNLFNSKYKINWIKYQNAHNYTTTKPYLKSPQLYFNNNQEIRKERDEISLKKASSSVAGTESFIKQMEILKDTVYMENLFKNSCFENMLQEFQELQKEENRHNLILYVMYLQCKDYKTYFSWLEINKYKFDKNYVFNILDHIINTINLEEVTYLEFEFIVEFYTQNFHKNLNLLHFLEKKLIKDFNDIESTYITNLALYFIKSNWKTNDEYFCDLLSRYIMCYFQRFNYNSFSIFVENYAKFLHTKVYTWRYLELSLIKALNSLYKPRTLERILVGMIYSNKSFGINPTIIQIIKNVLLSRVYAIHLSKIDYSSIALLIEGNYLKDDFIISSIKKGILKQSFGDINEFRILPKIFKNLYENMKEDEIEEWVDFIHKNLSEFINSINGSELLGVFECLNANKFLEFFDFERYFNKSEFFEKIKNSNYCYSHRLNLLYDILDNYENYLNKCENEDLKNAKIKDFMEFDLKQYIIRENFYSVSKKEIFVSLCNFVKKYKLLRNRFYDTVEEYFRQIFDEMIKSDYEEYKIAILSLPLYYHSSEYFTKITDDMLENPCKNTNEFLLRLEKLNSGEYEFSYDDEILMKNVLDLSNKKLKYFPNVAHKNCLDLDNPSAQTLKDIKEYSNFSYSQMENIYKCKFISSEYENFYKNL